MNPTASSGSSAPISALRLRGGNVQVLYKDLDFDMWNWHRSISEWLIRHKHRIGLIAIGHTAKRAEEYLFDWLLYGAVIVWCISQWGTTRGSLVAFAIMAPLSAFVCWLYILFYDWAKKDWLGLETIEELREREAKAGWLGRIFIRVTKLGDVPMFFVLSFYGDPFMTTVYFRRGSHTYKGLSHRDWQIFWASVLSSNTYWTLRWTIIVEIVRYEWKLIQGVMR